MARIPINKVAAVLSAEVDETVRAIKISLFSGVIDDTRVRFGRLKGNWQTTTGSPASGTLERLDPEGGAAKSEAASTVKADTVDYITNNLPYAEVWEERDGMVARNAARIERYVKENAK